VPVRLPAAAASSLLLDPLAGGAELVDQAALLELGHRGEDLADERRRRVVGAGGEVVAALGLDHPDPGLAELAQDQLAHDQIAGDPVGLLHDHDRPRSVGGQLGDLAEDGRQRRPERRVQGAGHALLVVDVGEVPGVVRRHPLPDGGLLPAEPVAVTLAGGRDSEVGVDW